MFPKNKFYQVTIKVTNEDENTGKLKKTSEVHLVDAIDTTDIAHKVMKEMEGTLGDWEITNISLSKISCVYD